MATNPVPFLLNLPALAFDDAEQILTSQTTYNPIISCNSSSIPLEQSVEAPGPDITVFDGQDGLCAFRDEPFEWLSDDFDFSLDWDIDCENLQTQPTATCQSSMQEANEWRKEDDAMEIDDGTKTEMGIVSFTGIHSCNICGTVYSKRRSLVRHQKDKHAGVRYRCEMCEKTFPRLDSLQRHVGEQHSHPTCSFKTDKKAICTVCGSKVRPSALTAHQESKTCRLAAHSVDNTNVVPTKFGVPSVLIHEAKVIVKEADVVIKQAATISPCFGAARGDSSRMRSRGLRVNAHVDNESFFELADTLNYFRKVQAAQMRIQQLMNDLQLDYERGSNYIDSHWSMLMQCSSRVTLDYTVVAIAIG